VVKNIKDHEYSESPFCVHGLFARKKLKMLNI